MEFPRGVSVNKIDSGKTLPLVHIAHMRNTLTDMQSDSPLSNQQSRETVAGTSSSITVSSVTTLNII